MKEPFANLDTRTIDEQIEQILQLPSDQRGSADNQCLQDLQYLYRKEQILARAAQRLQLADSLDSSLSASDANRQASIPGVTSVSPGMFTNSAGETAPLASIKMKRRAFAPFASYSRVKRRLLVSLSAALTLMVIVAFALLAVSSLGRNAGTSVGSQPVGTPHHQETPSTVGVSATATAIAQQQSDGAVPGSTVGITISHCGCSLNWPLGQSTYWANYRYHQLTGHWVQWFGNADQWVVGAREAGWDVSNTPPHAPSIIVLMPYVQGAGGYGHVGVVESMVTSSKAHTSNMDWFNGGGFDKVSYDNFTVGAGVYFIWKA